MEGAVFGFTPGVAKLADGAPTVPQCFSPTLAFTKGPCRTQPVKVVSWPFSELGYLAGSFRNEASFLACLRLFNFWTRHPGTAEGFFCAVLLALWFCALRALLYKTDPDRLCFSRSLLRKLHLLPKAG